MPEELDQLIEKAVAELKAAGAREVYIFGSAANGRLRENSDLDLAVSGLPPRIFYRTVGRLTDILDRRVDLIDLDEGNAFAQYLRDKGKLRRVG